MMTRRIGLMMGMLVLFLVGVGVGVLAQGEARPEAAQGGEAVNGVGTAFTYQGVLTDNEEPANGTYDLEFRLYDAATGGNQIDSLVTVNDHAVTDGLLTVALDFGEDVFTGSPRYLEIRVRPGSSTSTHEILAQRQPLQASPYAIHSGTAHALAAEMQPPTVITATATSGGQLSLGSYFFKIVASDGVGTSVGSEEVTCTVIDSSTNRCALVWEVVPGATVYRIYKGGTSNGQNIYQTSTTNSYHYDTDNGAATGTVPTTATAFVNHINPSGDSWLLGGNVGIGTTNPTAKLDVAGNVQIQGNLEVIGTSSTGPHFITPVTVSSGTGTVPWTTFDASAYIPVNATAVILELEGDVAWNTDVDVFMDMRKDDSSPVLTLSRWHGNVNEYFGMHFSGQGTYPIATNRTFQFTVLSSGSYAIKLVGYFN